MSSISTAVLNAFSLKLSDLFIYFVFIFLTSMFIPVFQVVAGAADAISECVVDKEVKLIKRFCDKIVPHRFHTRAT